MNTFSEKQGQYLAFIYYYAKINGRPPAEADTERYFPVSPPSIHDMVLRLEAGGWRLHREDAWKRTVDSASRPTGGVAGSEMMEDYEILAAAHRPFHHAGNSLAGPPKQRWP
jgi:repressor LexA